MKLKLVNAGIMVLCIAGYAGAQEKSVEDAYLNQSVATVIIREQAQARDRESKLLALEYLRETIEEGNIGEEVREILHGLALEGTLHRVRTEGAMGNDFPDIRMKAVVYLGNLKTPEAAETVKQILLIDPNPDVVIEAIHALTKIGINDNDRTVNAINYVFNSFDGRMPNNVMAVAVVDAFDTFIVKTGTKNPELFKTLQHISTSNAYTNQVRKYAERKLSALRK